MQLLAIVSLLTYAFGIFAFGSILVFWARDCFGAGDDTASPSESACSRAGNVLTGTLLFLCLVWFVAQLLQQLALISPQIDGGWFNLTRLVIVYFFPPLIMQTAYLDAQRTDRPLRNPVWRVALAAAWVLSPVLPVYTLLVVFDLVQRPPFLGRLIGLTIAAAFVLTAVYSSLAASLGRKRRETSDERAGRRWMIALYVGVALFCLVIGASFLGGSGHGEVFHYVGGSIPLLFIFTSLYHEARFRFVDLFVKRGLFLFLTVALLTLFAAAAAPLLDDFEPRWARPWIFALALLPLASALPWLWRHFAQWVDRAWFGRRLAPVEAIKRFLADMGRACTREQLIEQAERGLAAVFLAPVRIHLGLTEAPRVDGFDCVLDVPIRDGDERVGVILMGRRANQMPYFSEDVSLLGSLADVFSHMLQNIGLQERRQEQEQQARELSLQASRSELKALRAQINPHFLFNALNAIAALIHKNPARADQTVEQLAEVFRYTLRGSESEWAVLEEEMAFARAYLDVEQARFGRLEVSVTVNDAVRSAQIPTMMVQTLVENAVKHGVAAVRGPARIEVTARARDGSLVIEVADSGPGFEEVGARREIDRARRKSAGFGLKNVRERLAGHFGERGRLAMRREREMTVVSLVLPLERPAAGGVA